MSKEYAIWGKPPNQTEETLLLAQPQGRPITDPEEAQKLMAVLVNQHGCTDCRIQTIDMENSDMSGFERSVREDDGEVEEIQRRAGISQNWNRDGAYRDLKTIDTALNQLGQNFEGMEDEAIRQEFMDTLGDCAQRLRSIRKRLHLVP